MAISSVLSMRRTPSSTQGWLKSPAWDLTFISGSSVLVLVPYACFRLIASFGVVESVGASIVDLIVTLLIGGPHMYATFTRTVADPNFRANHRRIITTSILIPIVVLALGFNLLGNTFPYLMLVFFFWASLHSLHQLIFLVECYNRRVPQMPALPSRLIDIAVVFTSFYPLALYRFVHGSFTISEIALPFPDWLKFDLFVYAAFAAFAMALGLFLYKTEREIASGTAQLPKLLLISVAVVIAFFLPAVDRLDAALQGFNAWHCFQYLGLTWYANRLVMGRNSMASPGQLATRKTSWRFYGLLMLCTIATAVPFGILMLLKQPLGLNNAQPFYITMLSILLIHYYHDHVLFSHPETLVAQATSV